MPALATAALPLVIDMFSGCGGMSLGFQRAGFTIDAGFDAWKPAVATYSHNLDHEARLCDLADPAVTAEIMQDYADAGVTPAIIGGPPCQDFSPAGNRTEGARADLTEKYAQLIARHQPPFFVMENVARSQHAAAYKRAVETMESAGFVVGRAVLDASLCGVPQSRKRLFTIGAKDPSLVERIFELLHERQSTTPMTVRDWFGDTLGVSTYYQHPRNYARRGVFSIDEPSPTIRGLSRPVPPAYKQHTGDAGLAADTRALTTAERASIQTFPDDYEFIASKTATEQMIGNAVPPKLAEFVARAIADALQEMA